MEDRFFVLDSLVSFINKWLVTIINIQANFFNDRFFFL